MSARPPAIAPARGADIAPAPADPPPAVEAERARMRAKIVAWLRGVLVIVGLAPWILPVARARLPLGELGEALDLVFFTMCHRRPARTLVFDGVAMPLCSRCAGIFLGLALGAVIARPLLSRRAWMVAFGGACALMMADIVTQDLGLHPVWHPGRIATGVLAGYGMIIGALATLARAERSPSPGERGEGA